MNTLGKIPDTAISLLESKGISKDDILLITRSDMSDDMTLCDCYAVLTKEAVVVLAVGEMISRDEKSPFFTLFTFISATAPQHSFHVIS